MLRVALLSRWHPHAQSPDERYVKELLRLPETAVSCVWDSDPDIASAWGAEYGVPWETDLEAVLSREDVDGVIVTSGAHDHVRIITMAAERKKHIFTEKVLAFSLSEALLIRDAVVKSGVRFCIAFQRLAIPQLAYAKTLIESGTIGTPVLFRCLCGHAQGWQDTLPDYWYSPEITGGGAMIDLGFNSAYLARYILGEPYSVSSSFGSAVLQKAVEDVASCNVQFKNGVMAQLDATFDSPLLSVFELSLYGTEGAYYARFGGCNTAELRVHGKSEMLDVNALPKPMNSPIRTWYDACTHGASDADYGIDAAVDMVRFMVAAYRSAELDGTRVLI